MAGQLPETGRRVSLRRRSDDGAMRELVGYVVAADADRLVVRTRQGIDHHLPWAQVLIWRQVGVARGRDPRRVPLVELDRLAAAAGVSGRVFVARLADLLDHRVPTAVAASGSPPPGPACCDGEWVTTDDLADLVAIAWWAARQDARSVQVRTHDAAAAADLIRLGFTERRDHP